MSDNTSPAKVDGRRLRSDRSRQVIVEAMLQLIDQGNLVPTAQQVADHAKVGIRSVFRHFEDMEAIFATADELWRKEFNHRLQEADGQQSLQQRITHTVKQLGNLYEDHANILKSTATRRWRSAFLKHNYQHYQNQLRSNIYTSLPELNKLGNNIQEAVVAALSFEYWNRLRDHQSLSPEASISLLEDILNPLIGAK
jgi:AcrR family transcriptional regulator